MERKALSVVEALDKIQNDLLKASGYPDATVKDGGLAFAYGLVMGTISVLKADWERKLR